jgi:hypothetical protein
MAAGIDEKDAAFIHRQLPESDLDKRFGLESPCLTPQFSFSCELGQGIYRLRATEHLLFVHSATLLGESPIHCRSQYGSDAAMVASHCRDHPPEG